MPSTGTGFGPPQGWSNVPFYGTRGTFLADVNGDRKADLVAVNDDSVWVMLSTGTGFAPPVAWSTSLFYGNVTTTIGDVTGDGKADLIAINANSTWVMSLDGHQIRGAHPVVEHSALRECGSRRSPTSPVTTSADLVGRPMETAPGCCRRQARQLGAPAPWSSNRLLWPGGNSHRRRDGNRHERIWSLSQHRDPKGRTIDRNSVVCSCDAGYRSPHHLGLPRNRPRLVLVQDGARRPVGAAAGRLFARIRWRGDGQDLGCSPPRLRPFVAF